MHCNKKKLKTGWFNLSFLLLFATPCTAQVKSEQVIDQVVAVVGNNIILLSNQFAGQ
jgi:hypothetical protein